MHPEFGLVQIGLHIVIVKFFWPCRVFFFFVVFLFFCFFSCNFSCWSKFHVIIITGSRVVTIFLYKGLTRNPDIGNTPVWVLPNIWRLGRVRDTKFGMNISNEYWILENTRVTSFAVSELLRENQQGGS